jgi:hypothetical protein
MVVKQRLILLSVLIIKSLRFHFMQDVDKSAHIVEIWYLNMLGLLLSSKGFEENVICCELRIRLTVKMIVLWNVTPCSPVKIYESSEEICCL